MSNAPGGEGATAGRRYESSGGAVRRADWDTISPSLDQPAWYVVCTKRHEEQVARARLRQRGITSYLPMIVEWPRRPVGSDVQPMFPGYLFVHAVLPRDFYVVTRSQGVKRFVTVGGQPGSVNDTAVEFLRGREGPDGLIRWRPKPTVKSTVRVCCGPFRGLTALVERRLPSRERVLVLLNILQRETPVELYEKWITPV